MAVDTVRNGGGRWRYDEDQQAAAVEVGDQRGFPHNTVAKWLHGDPQPDCLAILVMTRGIALRLTLLQTAAKAPEASRERLTR